MGAQGELAAGDDGGELTYDDNGMLLSRVTLRDDGIQQEDRYVDGVRTEKVLVDLGDVFAWDRITNLYDETGRIEKQTLFDDGSERSDYFIAGQRVRTVQTDPVDVDLVDWTSRDVTYDADGVAVRRITLYDDGTDRVEDFDDGERALVTQEDLVLTARIWNLIATTYDAVGFLTGRMVTFDDGIERSDTFSGGSRQKTVLYDTDDVAEWDQIIFRFDPRGVIQSRQQVDDTGDVSLLLFEDGVRTTGVVQDVDNSEEWEARVTTYDASGVAAVTEYADGSEILAGFGPYFAEDAFLF